MSWVDSIIESSVYAGVFLVLVACGLGLPLPEDVPLILGGVAAGMGKADVVWVFIVSMAGVLVGDSAIYFAGRKVGPDSRIFKRFLSPERKAIVEDYFKRWGNWIVFFARFFAGIRAPCFFAAGVFRVRFWMFVLLDGIAALVSVPLWIWLGHWGASNRELLQERIEQIKGWVFLVVGALVALGLAWWLWRKFTRKPAAGPAADPVKPGEAGVVDGDGPPAAAKMESPPAPAVEPPAP